MKDTQTERLRNHADPRAYCDGKERLGTFALAERVAKRGRRNGESARHVYRCAKCAAYHIGELTGKRKRVERLRELAAEELE